MVSLHFSPIGKANEYLSCDHKLPPSLVFLAVFLVVLCVLFLGLVLVLILLLLAPILLIGLCVSPCASVLLLSFNIQVKNLILSGLSCHTTKSSTSRIPLHETPDFSNCCLSFEQDDDKIFKYNPISFLLVTHRRGSEIPI